MSAAANPFWTVTDIKVGRNKRADIGTLNCYATGVSGDFELLGQCDNIIPPTIAENNIAYWIYSDNADDVSAGIGANQVLIKGINSSYNPVTSTVDMSGTDAVRIDTDVSFMVVNSVVVTESQNGAPTTGAEGQIDIADASSAGTVYRSIDSIEPGISYNRSVDGYFANSRYEESYVENISAWMPSSGSGTAELALRIREYDKPPYIAWRGQVSSDNPKTWKTNGIRIPPRAYAEMLARRTVGSSDQTVWCSIEYIAVTNYVASS